VADISTKCPPISATIDVSKFAAERNSKLSTLTNTIDIANSVADMPA
jgi:hypothetical protein